MSIRFGTSITRRRRAYDRRCRGARDGAMAATTAIPPRRDRKRTATHARAPAGMQVRGANVQHSNARGRSATGGVARQAQRGCPEGRDGTSLCLRAQALLWITGLDAWRNAASAVDGRLNRWPPPCENGLTQRSRRTLQASPDTALEFNATSPTRFRGRAARDTFRWSSRWSSQRHRPSKGPGSGRTSPNPW